MFLTNPNDNHKISNAHNFIMNDNASEKKNALFHLMLKDNL